MVTTRQLATEVSLPINREIGGLEEQKTDPPIRRLLDSYKVTLPKERLLLDTFSLLVEKSLS